MSYCAVIVLMIKTSNVLTDTYDLQYVSCKTLEFEMTSDSNFVLLVSETFIFI